MDQILNLSYKTKTMRSLQVRTEVVEVLNVETLIVIVLRHVRSIGQSQCHRFTEFSLDAVDP